MRTVRRLTLLALGSVTLLGVTATPAAADLKGPCAASGTFTRSGVTVDPNRTDGPVEVEPEDRVRYTAGVLGVSGPRKVSGEIKVDLPAPLPDFTPGSWDDPDAVDIQKADSYSYDLPVIAPRGYEIHVSGFHQDAGLDRCSGSVTLRVKGGFFSSPAGPAALVLAAFSASGVVAAARPKAGA